ncbi:MAG: 30S ribosomal protein S13 [Candidatus Thermoplasmatota archaeon]|jgi:small subunit ribosomal protein S13|nr:30S ribosomal protein S13 [Candidatus Thermoplasmatota archaeon]MCL5794161.1 30S ribosomal protein S13 [Candidatus Thermoplasmatota archaeon]
MAKEEENKAETEVKKPVKKTKVAKTTDEPKKAEPKEKPKPKEKADFLYIVRIGSKDLSGERPVILALADLKGIGIRLAQIIVRKLKLDGKARLGDLGEETIEKIRNFVESKEYEGIPDWTVNHRDDVTTGADLNLVSNDLEIQLQDDLNLMKKARSYKGIRHETGHKVRGQRTRSNGRKGLAIGVIKKKEGPGQKPS